MNILSNKLSIEVYHYHNLNYKPLNIVKFGSGKGGHEVNLRRAFIQGLQEELNKPGGVIPIVIHNVKLTGVLPWAN